jgi:hypothetical protein
VVEVGQESGRLAGRIAGALEVARDDADAVGRIRRILADYETR